MGLENKGNWCQDNGLIMYDSALSVRLGRCCHSLGILARGVWVGRGGARNAGAVWRTRPAGPRVVSSA